MQDIQDEIATLLEAKFGVDRSLVQAKTKIFSSGILDSLSSLQLLMQIEEKFGISVSPLDVSIDDIDTIEAAADLVQQKMSK